MASASSLLGCMVCFLRVKTFPFSKVKMTSELAETDCGLLSLATSPELTGLSLAPHSERDVVLFLLLNNERHLDMMM